MDFDRIRQKLGLSKIQWREIGTKLKKLVADLSLDKVALKELGR